MDRRGAVVFLTEGRSLNPVLRRDIFLQFLVPLLEMVFVAAKLAPRPVPGTEIPDFRISVVPGLPITIKIIILCEKTLLTLFVIHLGVADMIHLNQICPGRDFAATKSTSTRGQEVEVM